MVCEMMVTDFWKMCSIYYIIYFFIFSMRNNRMAAARNLYLAFGLMAVANERLELDI
jgi:hypothetical protein